jgi:hypothetical protein
MARSRVGGTSGLLSGKVGDVIYAITRNPDGTFRQQISSNPEERFNPNTDNQARARCTMATIERAMFTFVDFVATGWEGIEKGTLSVSEFSRVNYNAIKEYLAYMWDFDEEVDNYWDLPKKGQTQPRDGQFQLSRGSLRQGVGLRFTYGGLSSAYFMIQTREVVGSATLENWLQVNDLHKGEQFVNVMFLQGNTPSRSFVAWVIIATEANVNLNTEITNRNFRSLLTLKSNIPCNVVFNDSTKQLSISFTQADAYQVKRVTSYTWRRRREIDGKLLYSTATLTPFSSDPVADYGWQSMRMVKSSWKE